MINEVKAIRQSGGRPSEEQLGALVSALAEKESRELADWGGEDD